MILSKIRVQNFKSIKDTGWIYLSKTDLITILAGQNESGKTSLLRALRFFGEGDYSTFEEEDRRLELSPRVDCTFTITEKEYSDLLEATNKQIADYIKLNGFNFVRGDTTADNFSLRYSDPADFRKLIESYNATQKELEAQGKEAKIFEAFSYFKGIMPEIVLYSSFQDNILPAKISYNEIKNNLAVQDFEKIYDVDFQELLNPNTSDKKREGQVEKIRKAAALSLNTYWKQKISGDKISYKFTISVKPEQSNMNNGYVNFFIDQGDDSQLGIFQKSQGFQWFVGFNLRLKAHEKELRDNGLILLIDEPGQGLHEIAQNDVKNVLEELSKEAGIQIIYSTHQPTLLGKSDIDFSRLLLVDRTNKGGTKFKTITQLISSNGSLDALSPIRTALGMVSILNPIQSNKKTIITEGITEYFYLNVFCADDIAIIPSTGVDQVPNIFSILYGWGVPAKALFDDDSQGKKSYNKLKNEFFDNDGSSALLEKTLLKPRGKSGIEENLSIEIITTILGDFQKTYNIEKTKSENVEQIGKMIFAKTFFDKFSANPELLDNETKENFSVITDFINK